MTRRDSLKLAAGALSGASAPAAAAAASAPPHPPPPARPPVVNGAEHAWVIHDARFPVDPRYSNCPNSLPDREYSGEHLISEMRTYGIDKTVISHVCYYGTNNSYASYCVRTHPDRFAAIGLLVGHRLYKPGDPENPLRLERAIKEEHLCGMRLSPIYDRNVVWLNDPVMNPFWKKAEEIGAVFNIFLAPHQIGQVGDVAQRFPGVKLVIDHIAMIDIRRPDSEGIEPLLALNKFPNVYIRTSLHNPSREDIPYRDMWPYLRRLYDAYGARRMIYANFFEYVLMKELIPFFTAEDKEWILGKTAMSVYPFRS
jgi:predicted TIM-barrel fold metal-dependent hydrolase